MILAYYPQLRQMSSHATISLNALVQLASFRHRGILDHGHSQLLILFYIFDHNWLIIFYNSTAILSSIFLTFFGNSL